MHLGAVTAFCAFFVAGWSTSGGISVTDLYPFGPSEGDKVVERGDDVSTLPISLDTRVVYYDTTHTNLYINNNGLVSFGVALAAFRETFVLPQDYEVIAVFLSDVDTTRSGYVYYRETTDSRILQTSARSVADHFQDSNNFRPRSVFIITWAGVGRYGMSTFETNTFQLVLASDGRDTYAFFHYPSDGLQWTSASPKTGSATVRPAQAGFDAGDGVRSFLLPASGTVEIQRLVEWTNVNIPGVWMFKIGNTRGGDIVLPQLVADGRPNEIARETCASAGLYACHSDAQCVDHANGFCCQCNQGFIGNGKSCITPGQQHRVSGKVTGNVNGVYLDEDLHTFVVTLDGRAYIAISKIPPRLGSSMRSLYVLADILGWLFAVSEDGQAKNGFTLTGGEFNRSMMIIFKPTGERLAIKQESRSGGTILTTNLEGTIPNIPTTSAVEVDDYEVTYRREQTGVIMSYAVQQYTVDGRRLSMEVDQAIHFQECAADPLDDLPVTTLKASRLYTHYGDTQEIVRYAMASKVEREDSSGFEDAPCARLGMECDPVAECVPVGNSFACQCPSGYQGNGQTCSNIDECSSGRSNCDRYAVCTDTPGSFTCRCRQGYTGDGQTCQRDRSCGSVVCDEHAQCVYDSDNGQPRCQCNQGYRGNGVDCRREEASCDTLNNCGSNALCVYDNSARRYQCVCSDGYYGDGFTCQPEDCRVRENCHREAECLFDQFSRLYQCVCKSGWTGDGYLCEQAGCDVTRDCDLNAECRYDYGGRVYSCVCKDGFEGDGKTCTAQPNQGCDRLRNCDANADCVYADPSRGHVCRCRAGYEGDGYSCRLISDCSRNPNVCDPNANCERRGPVYQCACRRGYQGNGLRCTAVDQRGNFLMLTQGQSIMDMPFSPTADNPGKLVLQIPGQTAVGIDVDCHERYVYWTDVMGKMIHKAKLDGTDSQHVLKNLGSPEGVAIDWLSRNMYWTDSVTDTISVASLDGQYIKTLFNTDLVNPRGIQVDPSDGYVFWTDWNRDAPKIERASMDGSERQTIISTDLGLPNGLTLDLQMKQVCWADAKTFRVECSNYDGRGRRTVASQLSYPFGLTMMAGQYYWTDWQAEGVQHIESGARQPSVPLTVPQGGTGKLFGITVARDQCPRDTNGCAYSNGGCRFLCLPKPLGARQCACPDNMSEDECNRTGLLL